MLTYAQRSSLCAPAKPQHTHPMPYAIGLTIAFLVGALARRSRLDRDNAFYPTILMVSASYYVLFATMSGSVRATAIETVVMTAFVIVAAIGFRKNMWLIAAAFAAHGVFDSLHASSIVNDGVPAWWPAFCLAYDAGATLVLIALLLNSRTAKSPASLPLNGQTNVNLS